MMPLPSVVLLDDEPLQLLALRAQLKGLAEATPFESPLDALAFLQGRAAHAVVVDIRMPGQKLDGLEFIRRLREFDRDIAVIIRTADESEEIWHGALELKAMRRCLKAQTPPDAFRRIVLEAVADTAFRRRVTASVRKAAATEHALYESLGSTDAAASAGVIYRSALHSIREPLSLLNSIAENICARARRLDGTESFDPAEQERLVREITEFAASQKALIDTALERYTEVIESPFGENASGNRASLNATLEALRQHLALAPERRGSSKSIQLSLTRDDALIAASPVALFNALKHLLEHLLPKLPAGAAIEATTRLADSPESALRFAGDPLLVLAPPGPPGRAACMAMRLSGPFPAPTAEELAEIRDGKPSPARTGNMGVATKLILACGGRLAFLPAVMRTASVEVILPLSAA
jgi:DNA-binding NarL/FixJ family response regulator